MHDHVIVNAPSQASFVEPKYSQAGGINPNTDSLRISDGPEALTPDSELAQRFTHWYNHGWQHIYRTAEGWRTETRYPLTARSVWLQFCNPDQTIGLRFGAKTRYGMIDIDVGSQYHSYNDPDAIARVRAALESIGIVRAVLIRSSHSEGLHLYFFLPEAVSTFSLACGVRQALADADLAIAPGQLEIFPNVKRYGTDDKPTAYNGHRLPLQPGSGSCLVNDAGDPVPGDLGLFLAIADEQAHCQDLARLKRQSERARQINQARFWRSGLSGKLAKWHQDLVNNLKQGFTSSGQTNQIVGLVAQFGRVFEGIDSLGELTSYIMQTVRNLPGFERFCRHAKDLASRAQAWAKSALARYTPAGTAPATRGNYWSDGRQQNAANSHRRTNAIERIEAAVASLSARGQLPDRPTARAGAIREEAIALFGTAPSKQTLYTEQAKAYWYPSQEPDQPVLPLPESDPADSPTEPTEPTQPLKPSQGEGVQAISLYEGFCTPESPASPPRLAEARSQRPPARARDAGEPDREANRAYLASDRGRLALTRLKAKAFAQRAVLFGGELRPAAGFSSPAERDHRYRVAEKLHLWRTGDPTLRAEVEEWLLSADLAPDLRAMFCCL